MLANPDMAGAILLRRWRRDANLTRQDAANALGISERMLAYYEAAERRVPRAINLAVRALSAGLADPLDAALQSRAEWVTLVGHLLDYGAGVPVVGQMLRERNRQGLANFLEFIKRGSDPSMALTDPALFQSLRGAVTRAQLSGLARFRIAAPA
jgi:transcriptional regulator with XRE-family HTH domain